MLPVRACVGALFLTMVTPVEAHAPLDDILQTIAEGSTIGILVVDDQGREIVSISADHRFVPASNTKVFTTAAAFALLPELNTSDFASSATVALENGSVILKGRGDARMSSAADCRSFCLVSLADSIAAKMPRVGLIVGDATFLPDERWSLGMSWNNIGKTSGTAIAALSIDDNEIPLVVTPNALGSAPQVDINAYYTVDNQATTVERGPPTLEIKRMPFSRTMILTGNIAASAPAERYSVGVDDPAHYSAWMLAQMLGTRGIQVDKEVVSRYRLAAANPSPPTTIIASIVPPPLIADIVRINKFSQNLHAELLLRRISLALGDGSVSDGLDQVQRVLTIAGLDRSSYDFSDGSGMSTYNRVTPRGVVTLLNWVNTQAWGAAFRGTLPVAGVDGTLTNRFIGTLLQGKLFAKTGSLNAVSALSGWMTAKSGKILTFSIIVNDIPHGAAATHAIDNALVAIAEAN